MFYLLQLDNISTYLGKEKGENWWEWTIYLDIDTINGHRSLLPSTLEEVEYVDYYLHPTFSDPVIRVYDRDSCFALTRRGWGTFEIKAKVVYKPRGKNPPSTILYHQLKFD